MTILIGLVMAAVAVLVVGLSRPKPLDLAVLDLDLQPVVSMVDGAGLHRKHGLAEVHGADFIQLREAPIRVARTELRVTHSTAWLLWHPKHLPITEPTHLEIQFNEVPREGTLAVGFLPADESRSAWLGQTELGPESSRSAPELPHLLGEEFQERLDDAESLDLVPDGKGLFRAELPAEARELANADKPPTLVVGIAGGTGNTYALKTVALCELQRAAKGLDSCSLGGEVKGESFEPGTEVELLRENGEVRRVSLSLDRRYAFDDLTPGEVVSIRYLHRAEHRFTVLGRWLEVTHPRSDVDIDLAPHYTNPDGRAPDPESAVFVYPREPLGTSELYEAHARLHWPGPGEVQEYAGNTFTNNMGFPDVDRTFEKPTGILRVVHLGSSHAVAIQIPPTDKYNLLLEEELSVRLQRPVEVISAGVDNGDIGANYPRFRNYALRFDPDVVAFETSTSLVAQLSPQMLRDGFGWKHDHSAIPNFYYDANGQLQPRPAAGDFGLHAVKPTFPEYTPGVPFFSTVAVPLDYMHPAGREAFDYLKAIVGYLQTHHADVKLVLHSALDQAQQAGLADKQVTHAGSSFPMGVDTFRANFATACKEAGVAFINPAHLPAGGPEEEGLTWKGDSHYTRRGHQWLASELAPGLEKILRDSE